MRSFVLGALTLAGLAGVFDPTSAKAQTPPSISEPYEALFARLLSSPDDPVLNKEFAHQAVTRGDLRLAFASLERVVVSSPGDAEAQAEFDNLRNKLMPAVTRVTVLAGANYASNPRQLPSSGRVLSNDPLGSGAPFSVQRPDDATFDARITVADERTIAGLRWRTLALAQGQFQANASAPGEVPLTPLQADTSALNTSTLAAESGPVFQLTPDLWMHVAVGAAIAWLDEHELYDDTSVGVTLGGLYRGLTQTVTASYTWRDGHFSVANDEGVVFADPMANNARIFDLEGRFVLSPSLGKGDLLYLLPRFQVSRNDGDPNGFIELISLDPLSFQRPLFPSDFTEAGGTIAYYYPLFGARAFLGAGIEIYRRWYDEAAATVSTIGDPATRELVNVQSGNRRDTYIAPTAHLILPNLLGPNLDLRFDYRFEHNTSNATTTTLIGTNIVELPADFENHVAGAHVVGRF